MANLNPDQKKALAQWAADGATLNEIQTRLKQEFNVTLNYMDTRLLVMELGLKLQDKPKEKLPEAKPQPTPGPEAPLPEGEGEGPYGEEDAMPPEPDDTAGGGSVTVTIDQLAIPGTMVSGKATFSDGKSTSWYLDQFGRLGLRATEAGYQPPAADIPVFQRELQRMLQQQGY